MEHQLWDYERLTGADNWHEGKRRLAESILAGDWRWKGLPSIELKPPIDWTGLCKENRSWALALHSWEPLAPLLMSYQHSGNIACLDLSLALVADWLTQFHSVDNDSPFAWYDLAVGTRAYRLAYMLDVAARDPTRSDEIVSLLYDGLITHATALAEDDRFARHSNHAFYQVMGQLATARRFPDVPELAAAGPQAQARLKDVLGAQFTGDGIHREHSPHYHHSILIPIRSLLKAGLVSAPELDEFLLCSEEALAWFITPAGHHVMFGDTSARSVSIATVDQFASAALRFAMSGGRKGDPPSAVGRGFPEAGYVVFRDRWPIGGEDFDDCSYLAQTCAFHSRVHKHADDLSFVWHDRGCEILTDAGRFGYVGKARSDSELFAEGFWYSDPRRVYVESTRAHNAVEIDGRSNPRRGVQPHGSGLSQWGERNGIRFSEARVGWGDLTQTRLLLFLPRSWLLVIDSLVDSAGLPHDFTQRFHLAPELELTEQPLQFAVTADMPGGDRLHAVPLLPQSLVAPLRGAEEPRLLGWISRRDGELDPQWTFAWQALRTPSHTFASLFCFTQESPSVYEDSCEVNSDATSGRFRWEADDAMHEIFLERVFGRTFKIEYCHSTR